MRFALALYLALYFLVVGGAVATLWRSGLVEHLSRTWTFIGIGTAVALGLLLAVLSFPPQPLVPLDDDDHGRGDNDKPDPGLERDRLDPKHELRGGQMERADVHQQRRKRGDEQEGVRERAAVCSS